VHRRQAAPFRCSIVVVLPGAAEASTSHSIAVAAWTGRSPSSRAWDGEARGCKAAIRAGASLHWLLTLVPQYQLCPTREQQR